MLVSYMNALEKVLLAKSMVASKAGHPNLRGGPREWFVEEFLESHLPTLWELGQGEIISSNSVPQPSTGSYRNQNDLIIYRRDFPKISYSPRDKAYLVEGVVATIEIKTKMSLPEFRKACKASIKCKNQISQIDTRLGLRVDDQAWTLSHIISYVVAYDGPVNMSTASNWFPTLEKELDVESELLVDMIVIFGKGVAWRMEAFPAYRVPNARESDIWAYIEQPERNLYAMFVQMLTIGKISSSPPKILGYINQLPNDVIKTV